VIRLLFDENMGRNVVRALNGILQLDRDHPVEVLHLLDFVDPGEADHVWLMKLAELKPIVITRDKGRKHPRLPNICAELDVTHIICTPGMQRVSSFELARAVVHLWPEIVTIASEVPGSRYRLAPGPTLTRG